MIQHLKFIAMGSTITSLISYVGLIHLIINEKIFVANYTLAIVSTFIIFYCLSFIIWTIGSFLMNLIFCWKKNISRIASFYLSATLLIFFGFISLLFFYFVIMNIPFNPWYILFPGLPLLSALVCAPFLIKICYSNKITKNTYQIID